METYPQVSARLFICLNPVTNADLSVYAAQSCKCLEWIALPLLKICQSFELKSNVIVQIGYTQPTEDDE